MKKEIKIFFSTLLAIATIVGCTNTDIEDIAINPTDEQSGTFRIAASTPTSSDDTKVDVDWFEVTWNESDVIKIAEIGDNGAFVTSYTYTIDAASISDGGKYAEFTGSNLTAGKKYIAYNYQGSGSVESNTTYDFANLFQCSYDYSASGSYDPSNLDLMMQSDIFEYDGVSSPQLYFNYKSSLLWLDIALNSDSQCTLESLTISNSEGVSVFATDLLFDSYGEYAHRFNVANSSEQYGVSSSIEVALPSSATISSSTSTYYSVAIPITWNDYITELEGDFAFKITTTDGRSSTTSKAMKVLEDGTHYTALLSFDEPEGTERSALIALYNATGGDDWTNNENWCSDADISEWYGVTVNSSTQKVTQISLFNNNLSGTIPDSIKDLTSLVSLNLGYNALTGSINESIGELTNLQSLYLSYNYHSGSIPDAIGNLSNLRYLYISYNTSLTGSIPDSIWGLKNLVYLDLSYDVGLSGSIPDTIGNLTKLWYLNLTYNQFSGELPTAINTLSDLQYIYLTYNNFTGAMPSVLETNFNWNEVAWNVLKQNEGYGFSYAPDVYLEPSTVTTTNGTVVNSEEFFASNKLTCVLLWRTWCGWSTYYFSTIKSLYTSYAASGLGLISMSDESDLSTITTYVDNNSIPGYVCQLSGSDYADGSNRIKYMPTSSSPTYAFVDSSGKVVFSEYLYQFDDTSLSRESATSAFVKSYLGDSTTEQEESSDYSKDGEVVILQSATEGSGINLVIMGDGFTDTDMGSGGVYETRMTEAMEHLFSEEPFTTYRDRFNVYAVKAVSANQGVDGVSSTAISCQFGDGSSISGDVTAVLNYACKVPTITSESDLSNLLMIVVLNSFKYAGTCYMYSNDAAIAYCPIVYNDDEYFRQIITHEAGGHGFGKLFDEYDYSGTITTSAITSYKSQLALGWGANVDITNDASSIKWSHMLSDSRYDGLVGIYEGALTYEYGAYRPTDVSIMRYNTGGYNPPSREEIYRRIMVLSGSSYDYEEFVAYDAVNRSVSSLAYSATKASTVDKSTFVPLAKPVFVTELPLFFK